MATEAVKVFGKMAKEAKGNRGMGTLRWDVNGQARQITVVKLLIDDDAIQVEWGPPAARQQAEVDPKTLRQMVRGQVSSTGDDLVNWYYIRNGNIAPVSSTVDMLIALGLDSSW